MRGGKRGQRTGIQLPSMYKPGYISFSHVLLLRDKEADGEMWQEFRGDESNKGAMAGNIVSLKNALWVSGWLIIGPKEVDVEMLTGEIKTMSMDDFKELIRKVKDE